MANTTKFLDAGTDSTYDLSLYQGSFTTATGTIGSASDQTHTGSRSLKSVSAVTNDEGVCYSADGVGADAGTGVSFWTRFSAIPAATTAFWWMFQAGFGNAVLALGITSAGKLTIGNEGFGILGTGTTTISATTWTRISISWVITSASSWSLKIYVNGVLDLSLTQTAGTLISVGSSEIAFGIGKDTSAGFSSTSVMTVWFDDIYVDNRIDKTDPGDIRVTAKRPNANGTVNGFTTQIGSGGSGYGTGHSPQVNEQPLSQTNGWAMVGAGSAVTEEYNVEAASVGDVNISGLTIVDYMGWVFAKTLLAETGKIILSNVQTNISLTSTASPFMVAAGSTTYPAGSGTDIGIITSTTLTTVSLYECGIIIAYLPAAPATGNSNFFF